MNPTGTTRRRRGLPLAPERLESRELMTGGAGDTFALISGTVSQANQTSAIKFTIDPSHFTLPKGGFTLGIDVVAETGSSIKPQIVAVDSSSGRPLKLTRSAYAANLPNSTVKGGQPTSAILTPVHFNAGNTAATYTVLVKGLDKTTGGYLVGFYLPGDVAGSGTVNQADITTIKSDLGSKASTSSTSKYNFNADANRDGRIDGTDLKVAEQNLGVSTTISPVLTAALAPASQTTIQDGALIGPSAMYTGQGTPGETLTFSEINNQVQPVTTTINASGNYSITVPVAPGTDTFQVTTLDAFGQSISGTLSPVTYNPSAASSTATTTATTSTTGTTGS